MNRELLSVLFIGAITTVLVMAFFISIPVKYLFIIIALILTIYSLTSNKILLELYIILIVLFISQLNFIRTKNTSDFSGLNIQTINSVDLIVTKDSIPLSSGYWAEGEIYLIRDGQIETTASIRVGITSRYALYKGEVFTSQKLHLNSNVINIGSDSYTFDNIRSQWRAQYINFLYEKTNSALFVALVSGSKVFIDRDVLNTFRESGCSHILAMSGFHIGVLTLLIFILLKPLFWGYKLYTISFVLILGYILFIGFTPSLLRSLIMFLLTLFFKIRHQRVSIIYILTISFLITVLLFPKEFYTLSFQLSYLALLSIVVIGQELIQFKCFYLLPSWLSIPLMGSISALLGTALLSFYIFENIYISGIICSIIVTPLITMFIGVGLLSIPLDFISPMLIKLEKIIYYITSYFSKFPVIDKRANISLLITSIIIVIPIILLILKLIRRRDARRFNIEFKL